jgi:hypothetical protein
MRTYILAPIDRRKILLGKNIAVTIVAFVFSVALHILNAIVFRDTSLGDVLYVSLSFVVFAGMLSIYGNWVSVRFPKRMQFGKRMNVSGIGWTAVDTDDRRARRAAVSRRSRGVFSRNVSISYLTLAMFAVVVVVAYAFIIDFQGRDLARREIEILETVREPSDE